MPESDDGDRPGLVAEDLLRPCRDLAANWNVDIVAKLEAYLADLHPDIDIGNLVSEADARVNFQHAALLIEGGACVYSRKVDYLYGLVFAAADMIYEARGKAAPSKSSRAVTSSAEDDADATPAADGIDFLLLNHLDASAPPLAIITLPLRDADDDSADFLRQCDANRLVSVPLHLLPAGPHNSRRASFANANTAGLRMPAATINEDTGALILDGIGVDTVERTLSRFDSATTDNTHPSTTPSFDNNDGDDDDGDDGGGGPDFFGGDDSDGDFGMPVDVVQPPDDNAGGSSTARNAGAAGATAPTKRLRDPSPDPYEPLDPHDASAVAERPVQRGKTWTKPRPRPWRAAPDEKGSWYAGMCDPPRDGHSTSSSYLEVMMCVMPPKACSLSRRTNRFVSFEAAAEPYRARLRLFAAAKRRRARLARALHGDDDGESDCGEDVDDDGFGFPESNGFQNDDGQDAEDGGDFPDFGDVEHDGDGDDDAFGGGLGIGLNMGMASALAGSVEAQVERIAASYEDQCRKYLLESSKLWQEHAVDSQLEQRVADWRTKIEPLLAEEEERPGFDIKEYSNAIVGRLEDEKERNNCQSSGMNYVFSSTEPYEVCRNFLATLQLINSNQIEIVPVDHSTSSADDRSLPIPTIGLLQQTGDKGSSDLARTPSIARVRPPLSERTSNVFDAPNSPQVRTPRRRPPGKRHRQAGGSPLSSRRAATKPRTNAVGSPIR